MFIGALWVLEQQQKAWDWLFPQKIPVDTPGKSVMAGALLTAMGVQTAIIGSTPYVQMVNLVNREDLFLRQLKLHSSRSAGGMGIPQGFQLVPGKGFRAKFMKASFARSFGAKVATRFIPYAGWALFAVDMFHVGKWIGEKTSPF